MRAGMIGIEGDGAALTSDRLSQLAAVVMDNAEVVVTIGAVGVERHASLTVAQRLVKPARDAAHLGKVAVPLNVGAGQRHGTRHPCDGIGCIAAVPTQHAEQMRSARMVGVRSKYFSSDLLRGVEPS